jgi:peroxiredoxin (alkyl hydroperoxide reductase subunit C)
MGDNLKINIFEEAINNKKSSFILVSKDFTFVCPTELHAFQDALPEFEKEIQSLVLLAIQTKYILLG